ncbi:energy transducer TonB [Veillonella sp. VA139]|uniref:energy transducer TonB n=1 Tax=Veillonella sp. VA139 TaxID=741830 RepID=UPI000F8DA0FD|nr:energy transducer TonB [Veillonella sp. VA139]
MEQYISWKKSYIISIVIHILLAVVLGLALVSVVEHKQTENAFEIDMSISDDLKASAGGGGGGGGVSFPKPLSQEVVQAKVQAAQQSISTQIPAEDALNLPTSPTTSTTGTADGTSTNQGIGGGSGGGNGTGNGTGDGDGNGSGSGGGSGSGSGGGNGDGVGTTSGNAPFDWAGFVATVQAQAQGTYPAMAIKRNLQGSVSVSVTIDASGNIVSVSAGGGPGILNSHTQDVVYGIGNYPNGSGTTVSNSFTVYYTLNEE